LVTTKDGSRAVFPWELFAVLAIWAGSLVAERPKVVFHFGPRWIGENVWVGIPVLIALAVFAKLIVRIWRRTPDERELGRLIRDRLRAERKDQRRVRIQRKQERKREAAELQKQADELTRQADELRRKNKGDAAELQRQWVQAEIEREERLRDERLGIESVA
jgi:flagellar biosynthesis/type III secretory pathway M-ring protein FliF/YscJ